MPLSDHSGKNSFNLNNKSFTNRAASGSTPIYDIASSGGAGGGAGNIAAIVTASGSLVSSGMATLANAGLYSTTDPVNFPALYRGYLSSYDKTYLCAFQNKTSSWAIMSLEIPTINYSGNLLSGQTGYWRMHPSGTNHHPFYGVQPVNVGPSFDPAWQSSLEFVSSKAYFCLVAPEAVFGLETSIEYGGKGGGMIAKYNKAYILSSLGDYNGDALKAQYDSSNLSSVWSELNMSSSSNLYICDAY
jgi:hypothetical protein